MIQAQKDILKQVKETIRNKYAWPGGYALLVVMHDGAYMCPACARENYKLIARATSGLGYGSSWEALGAEVYWEGPDDYCANCYTTISSEYGDPEKEEKPKRTALLIFPLKLDRKIKRFL